MQTKLCSLLIAAILMDGFAMHLECLNFSYVNFTKQNEQDFVTTEHSYIAFDAIQVTGDARGASILNLSGRIWYEQPFRLWSERKNTTASFNSTFVLNITPQTDPTGEGLAFILTGESGNIPENSYGEWLGVVNATTNGSSSNNIVAVEFDTRKSYFEDLDDNHVGVDVNSVYSVEQVSLNGLGINLSSAVDVTVEIQYDGETRGLKVFVFMSNQTGGNRRNPVISMPFDLQKYLPENVYVGFSASTGVYTQLNCIKAWEFIGTDLGNEDDPNLFWLWILIPAILVLFLAVGLVIFLLCQRKKRRQMVDHDTSLVMHIEISSMGPQRINLREIKRATGNFDPKNVLGRGGCGVVYKGLLGQEEVAVKRFFSKDSSQGMQDFVAEITTIGNLNHKNLVKLTGWCYESNELLLVYEFMPNGSLDRLIFGGENRGILSWGRRYSIISGVAQALDYLHNGSAKRVLHRDIKASNIMLDSDFNAKLGDFGLARTIQAKGKTHHTTKEIAGTPGYMAPESFHIGRATVETDVYAFGILILEVACGRKPVSQDLENNYSNRIVDWVWDLCSAGKIKDAMDERLNGKYEEEQAVCLLELGLGCCHPNPYQRPSIRTALQILEGEAAPWVIPTEKPAFTWPAKVPAFDKSSGSLISGQITPISELSGR